MYREIAKLIIYGELKEDSILYQIGEIFRRLDAGKASDEQLVMDCYKQVRRLLEISTEYGFDKNLWHNYLTYLLITNENPFSMTCEKEGANEGSVNIFAKNDFKVFKSLFDFDFSSIEAELGIDCFSMISKIPQNVHKIEQDIAGIE
jgi:hypothetical protein